MEYDSLVSVCQDSARCLVAGSPCGYGSLSLAVTPGPREGAGGQARSTPRCGCSLVTRSQHLHVVAMADPPPQHRVFELHFERLAEHQAAERRRCPGQEHQPGPPHTEIVSRQALEPIVRAHQL